MDRLTTLLIGLAVGLGLLAARDARKGRRARASQEQAVSDSNSAPRAMAAEAQPPTQAASAVGGVVLRNDHIDDGIAVRSPFDGDRGITRTGSPPA